MHCKLVTCRAICVYSNPFTDAAILCLVHGHVGGTCKVVSHRFCAAWYITRLLVKLTPKGVVFSFLFSVIGGWQAGYLNSRCRLVDMTQLTWKGRTGLLMSAACMTALINSTRSSSFSSRKGPAATHTLTYPAVKKRKENEKKPRTSSFSSRKGPAATHTLTHPAVEKEKTKEKTDDKEFEKGLCC